jgi:hypothetical protein
MQETVVGLGNVNAIAVAGRASVVFRLIARYHCECASANHGGLTSPRSCVARMRVCWVFATSATRTLPNHGGLTPPALALRECVSPGDLRLPLHACYPTTGGSRPPLLAVHAFVHHESRHFAGKRSRIQTGAAGVHVPGAAE